MKPRILCFDIEVAPMLAYSWGPMYEAKLIDLVSSWHILCFAYRWVGSKKTHTIALQDFPEYKKDKTNDKYLCEKLYELFCEADLIVAHNIKFDVKKAFARFIKHGFPPPPPTKLYCTLQEARRRFAFTSNRLGDLARYLLHSRKLPHSGWDTWREVLAGSKKQWRIMRRYCAHDCDLLHDLYLKLRSWSPTHPRLLKPFMDEMCPTCTSSRTIKRGVKHFRRHSKQQRKCLDCDSWFLAEPIK